MRIISDLRSVTIGLIALIAIGAIGYALLMAGGRNPSRELATPAPDADAMAGTVTPAASIAVPEDPEPAQTQAPGLRGLLLSGTDANRDQLLRRSVTEAGFDCSDVISSGPVGREGHSWRINCGNSQVYFVDVDEFNALSVRPTPYGNFEPGTTPVLPGPGSGGRSLELREVPPR